jgi:two-component system, NtrC family, response regulator GlrR
VEREGIIEQLRQALGTRMLMGESQAFLAEAHKIPAVAACDAGVLILGETGTGKELFARAIHYLSPRRAHAFVPINCGALPLELVENELFGHERAAYTGAVNAEPGLITEAEGGTLFLDEVDSLPLTAQVKLLRFLETKEYRRLGSSQLRRADLRVVAATNVDLEFAMAASLFRRDLYYRLNVVQLELPPLRERPGDLLLLARHFLRLYARELHRSLTDFTPEALRCLALYSWPGNVRELENTIQRAVILAASDGGLITERDFKLPDGTADGTPLAAPESFRAAKGRAIAQFERHYLEGLLASCGGNVSRAARTARKDRSSFWSLVKKHGIDIDRFRPDTLGPVASARRR